MNKYVPSTSKKATTNQRKKKKKTWIMNANLGRVSIIQRSRASTGNLNIPFGQNGETKVRKVITVQLDKDTQ